jgi:hypothetical protein
LTKKKSKKFIIESGRKSEPDPITKDAASGVRHETVGVSLRYFQKNHECFSAWSNPDLKKFSGFVTKMAGWSKNQVTQNTKFCHAHRGNPKKLPAEVSPDQKIWSLDVTGAGRAHGFFSNDTFYLVWLDREGKVLGH